MARETTVSNSQSIQLPDWIQLQVIMAEKYPSQRRRDCSDSPFRSQPAKEVFRAARGKRRRGKRLILLRGLPGSGKTTLAKSLVGVDGEICCTDDFFVVDGQYLFDRGKLPENHEKNRRKARAAMIAGKSPVIIDNTNISSWTMKPYVVMAVKEFNYSVEILEPQTPWRFKVKELARRNTHNVNWKILVRLREQFEHGVSVESILQSSTPPTMQSSSSSSNEQVRSKNSFSEPHDRRPTSYRGSLMAISRLKLETASEAAGEEERRDGSGVTRARVKKSPKVPEGGYGGRRRD